MDLRTIKIKQLRAEEIDHLNGFPIEDWNLDIKDFMHLHIGQSHFYPIAARIEDEIIGIANVMINDNKVGWMGNILVKDNFNQMEIHEMLLRRLIDFCINRTLSSILIFADLEHEELYKTLGFRKSTEYVYLNGNQISGTHSENIRKIKDSDYEAILRIDQEVTGEYRPQIIEPYLTNGFVFEEDTEVQGFFLPELGNGLIIAATDKAGLYLLQYKHGQQEYTAVIPKGNHTAIDFLYQNGFEEVNRVNRMYMGNEVLWKPEKIFARGTKYGG